MLQLGIWVFGSLKEEVGGLPLQGLLPANPDSFTVKERGGGL